jgi:hypothetical protein
MTFVHDEQIHRQRGSDASLVMLMSSLTYCETVVKGLEDVYRYRAWFKMTTKKAAGGRQILKQGPSMTSNSTGGQKYHEECF